MTTGVALALAVLLAGAGAPKLWRPGYVAAALRRVFRRGRRPVLRAAGRLLGAWELLLAAALLTVGGVASVLVAAATAVTFVGFTGFVVVAVRRGASCGCWASLTEGPAGGAELARTGVLSVAAVALPFAGVRETGVEWAAVGWALALLGLTWLAAEVGERLSPVRSAKIARRLALRAEPTRRGRALARLAFLAGFVHAGTNAGQHRLVTALAMRQRTPAVDKPPPPTITLRVPVDPRVPGQNARA